MKISKDFWIILGFALLHAAVALGCRLADLADEMMLTLLTMLLVVILCLRCRVDGKMMSISVVAVNVLGVLLGRGTALLFDALFDSPLVIYPLSTFVSTLVIGWVTLWAARRYAGRHAADDPERINSLKWLLIAFGVILVTRLAIILFFSEGLEGRNTAVSILLDYSMTIAVVVVLAAYALRLQSRAKAAAEEAALAQFRYHKLKQQVNPHFLFNSLNILDCLIQEQTPQEASRYTHKLAEVYRYLIKNEDETTVRLRDEMGFVAQYVDLLKVRFPEGLEVDVDIPESAMSRSVVPCCVQLLLENATKHNAVRPDKPLRISVRVEGDGVVVSNNRVPRLTRPASTGLGLQYIRQQYHDLSGKRITVLDDEQSYTVILPLL
ncbi:MAG: histidine kinase [Bacteroidales bacterium]|nr:histidine kinase [Bacteroidales bacterium]